VTGRASEIFKQHVSVAPYHEEDCAGLAHLIGADRVLMGSDFPHAEGLAKPSQFADSLGSLSSTEIHRVMRDNLRELLAG